MYCKKKNCGNHFQVQYLLFLEGGNGSPTTLFPSRATRISLCHLSYLSFEGKNVEWCRDVLLHAQANPTQVKRIVNYLNLPIITSLASRTLLKIVFSTFTYTLLMTTWCLDSKDSILNLACNLFAINLSYNVWGFPSTF